MHSMQLRNIDLNQLVVLDALLRERSVKAAALQLALSLLVALAGGVWLTLRVHAAWVVA